MGTVFFFVSVGLFVVALWRMFRIDEQTQDILLLNQFTYDDLAYDVVDPDGIWRRAYAWSKAV